MRGIRPLTEMAVPQKYPALTGVRAVGATVVFFDHLPLWPDLHITLNVLAFFFALSGFLIVRLYYEGVRLGSAWLTQYFVNRFARIYPVYALLLTAAVLLGGGARPWVLVQNYTLTHALFHGTPLLIAPSWSLTVEECFYFLAPLLMLLAHRGGFLAPFVLSCVLSAIALAVSRLGVAFLGTPAFVLSTTFFGHFVEFFAGVFLALVVMRQERHGSLSVAGCRRTLLGSVLVLMLIAAMVIVYRHRPLSAGAILLINNLVIPVPIALLYWGLIREDTVLARLLSQPWARLLGRASYSFYLLHTLVIDYVGVPLLLPALGSRPLAAGLTCVVTWIIAIGLFVSYEEPVNVFIRRRLGSHSGSVRGATAGRGAARSVPVGRPL
ncbi:MAG TPA: acyltransferase [Steroidobacteraceae bacterium]|nr:acyltransferase [Steroidobacteraceae bacterium]